MLLKEFIKKYNIFVNHAQDRSLCLRNDDNEVFAYAVSYSGKLKWNGDGIVCCDEIKACSHAFIFRSSRILVGIINGERRSPEVVYKFINNFNSEKEITCQKELERQLILKEL